MRLLIMRKDGTVDTVMIDIEQYDFKKPMAKAILCDNVEDAIERTKVYEGTPGADSSIDLDESERA